MRLSAPVRLGRTARCLFALLLVCLLTCGASLAQSSAIAINFQPAASPVPAGYLKDSGEVYGDRGNGYSYGWNQFASISRDYDSANSQGRQDYDTVIATNGLNWEIALPSGGYRLTLCVGNPTLTANTRFKMLAEGQTAIDETVGPAAAGGYFAERSVMVTVTDGKLTLTNAGDIPNNNVCYLKIEGNMAPQQAAVLTATTGAGVVHLSWSSVPGALSYRVVRATAAGGTYTTLVDNLAATSYTDTTAVAGATYFYKVIAKNQVSEGAESNIASTLVKGGIKVNCGGSEYVSATRGKFRADAFFSGGSAYTLASGDVQDTEDDALYRAMRAGSGTFTYTFSGLGTGSNDLVLHFVEPTAGAAGARKFNVLVNGVTRLSNFDVFAEAGGKLKALTKTIPVQAMASGQVTVSFVNVTGNAMVSAIELHTAPAVNLISPVDRDAFTAPASISLKATASDFDGYVSHVEFYSGQNKIAEDAVPSNGPNGEAVYESTWETVADGVYDISARAVDNDGRVSATGSSHVTVGVAKPGATTLTAIADAYVRGGLYADGNFGTVSPLLMRNDPAGASYQYEGYLKFDISGLTQFTSVQLQLSARLSDGASQRACTVYGLGNTDWTEMGITWNNRPAAGDALGSFTPASAAYNWCSVDVTSHVQAAKNNHQDYVAFAVRLATSGAPYVLAYSRETASAAPRLVVGAPSANQSPVVTLTAPAAEAQFTAPASITLTADALDPDGGITLVEFWANGQKVGEDRSFAHTFTWTNVADGVYSLVARAFDNDGAAVDSAPVRIQVGKALIAESVDAEADAHVQGGAYANDRFGTATQMILRSTDPEGDNTRYAYLRFRVPALPLVEKATLRVRTNGVYNDRALNTSVYSVANNNWIEEQIVFSGRPAMDGKLGSYSTSSTVFEWKEVDVTAAVRQAQENAQHNGGLIGFGLKNDVATFGTNVTAREAGTGLRPHLVIGRAAPNAAPTISITAPVTGARVDPGSAVAVSADAADADGVVTRVEFYAGGMKIGQDAEAPYSVSWAGVPAGSYTLTAKAYDNDGAVGESTAVAITANTLPTVALTAPTEGAVFTAPEVVTLAATASDAEGVAKVEFYRGEEKLGEDSSAPYEYAWTSVGGSHTFSARAVDTMGAMADSAPVNVGVRPGPVTGLVATAGEGLVHLVWDAVPGATSYNVLRKVAPAGEGVMVPTAGTRSVAVAVTDLVMSDDGWTTIATVEGTEYTDADVAPGTCYFYQAQGSNNSGTGAVGGGGGASATPTPPADETREFGWKSIIPPYPMDTNFYLFNETVTIPLDPPVVSSMSWCGYQLFYDLIHITGKRPEEAGYPYPIRYEYREPAKLTPTSEEWRQFHEWSWHVPLKRPDETGTVINEPDYDNYPAPQLFVLGKLSLNFSFGGEQPASADTLSWDVKADNWNAGTSVLNETFHAFGTSATPMPDHHDRRRIIPATLYNDSPQALHDNEAQAILDPAFSFSVQSTLGGADGSLLEVIGHDAMPILMTLPDPFARPDNLKARKDKTNMYVYPAVSSPIIEVPGKILVPDADEEDLRYLLQKNPRGSDKTAYTPGTSNLWMDIRHIPVFSSNEAIDLTAL